MASRLLKMAFWRQLWTNLSPSWLQVASRWGQVGLKLPQVGTKLDPSWLRLDPKSAPGGSPKGSWEGPGMVLEPRGAPGGPRGAKIASKTSKMTQNGSQKASNLIQNLLKTWRNGTPGALRKGSWNKVGPKSGVLEDRPNFFVDFEDPQNPRGSQNHPKK